jgi:hypothetical protein
MGICPLDTAGVRIGDPVNRHQLALPPVVP